MCVRACVCVCVCLDVDAHLAEGRLDLAHVLGAHLGGQPVITNKVTKKKVKVAWVYGQAHPLLEHLRQLLLQLRQRRLSVYVCGCGCGCVCARARVRAYVCARVWMGGCGRVSAAAAPPAPAACEGGCQPSSLCLVVYSLFTFCLTSVYPLFTFCLPSVYPLFTLTVAACEGGCQPSSLCRISRRLPPARWPRDGYFRNRPSALRVSSVRQTRKYSRQPQATGGRGGAV